MRGFIDRPIVPDFGSPKAVFLGPAAT